MKSSFKCNFQGLESVVGEVVSYDISSEDTLIKFRGGAELKVPFSCNTNIGKTLSTIGLININSANVNFNHGTVTIVKDDSEKK